MDVLDTLTDAQIAQNLVEIAEAFDAWEREARLPVPACMEATLGRQWGITPREWRQALTYRRDLLVWEQRRRAAGAASHPPVAPSPTVAPE